MERTKWRRRGWLVAWLAVSLAGCSGSSVPAPAASAAPSPAASAARSPAPTTSASAPDVPSAEPGSPTPSATTSAILSGLPGRLLFSRFNERTHTFISMHSVRPDGTDEVEIPLPGPEGGGRWSTAGDEIAVMTLHPDGRGGTAILAADGSAKRVLDLPEDMFVLCSVWSADDSRLACYAWHETDETIAGIHTVRSSDGGDLKQLTDLQPELEDILGDFSPDGQQFIFKRGAPEADGTLMLVDVDEGGEPRPLSSDLYEDAGRFSPDGSLIATSVGGRVVILDMDGSVVHEVSESGAYLFGPDWSPDGQWIAYSRSTSGPFADVFIARPDGSDTHQVTRTSDNEIAVDWGNADS